MIRILITRLSAIGDCIHTMPLVGVLRRRFPGAFIAWVTQGGPASLLEGYPGLDQVIVVRRDWWKSPSSIQDTRRRLRSLKFDISIDPQSLTKSSVLGWLSGASQRIGFAPPQGRELSGWLNTELVEPRADHVVDRYLQVLAPLVGETPMEVRFELPLWRHDNIQSFLEGCRFGGRYAVINPGAGWDSKLWPPDRFGAVANYLGEQHRLPSVVVWAGDREREWAGEIVAASNGHAYLAPSTSLPELATLMRGADFCLAGDTGPLHLAAAVGIPCLGLYGTTLPQVCGPYGRGHQCVQAYHQEGSCRERRSADNLAMQAIDVPTVAQACDRILQLLPSRQAA
jgi:heptosyltransferase-1